MVLMVTMTRILRPVSTGNHDDADSNHGNGKIYVRGL